MEIKHGKKWYSDDELRTALANEWEYLITEDPEDDDTPLDEYIEELKEMTTSQLIEETSTDNKYFTLDEYMETYGEINADS